ncbi:MAG: PAS domain S-box protein [Magnetospirillum sp.]|nr:MAG: PAS domain S-box protein [Magnetospirillum sp.]
MIVWLALIVLGGVWFVTNAITERGRALRAAEFRVQTLSELALENVHRLLEGADTALTAIAIMVGGSPDWDELSRDRALWQALHDMGKSLSAVPRLTVADADGMIRIHGDQFAITPVWVGDRDYFSHHRDHASPAPFMGVPIIGRITQSPLLPFSRRLSRADGTFAGLVNANIEPRAFLDLFVSMRVEEGGFFVLQRGDGTILARSPVIDGLIGRRVDDVQQHPGVTGGLPSGTAVTVSPVDGVNRITAFKRLEGYDLVLIAGLPVARVLAPWWRQTLRMAGVFGVGFVVLTGLLVLLMLRRHTADKVQERLRASEENLRQAQAVAKLGYYVYDMVADRWVSSDILDGIFDIDAAYPRTAAGWLALVAPAMRPEMTRYLQEIAAGQHDFEREYQIIRHGDGLWRWVTGVGRVEYDGDGQPIRLVGTIQDVTEQRLDRERLRSSEEKLRSLFDLAPLGIALTDLDGHFLEANRAFHAIVGYSLEQLNRLSYWDLTPQSYAEQEERQLECLRTQGRYGPYEKEYITRSGRPVPVVLNGVLVNGGDGNSYIWSIVEDITERKKAHEALRDKAAELVRSNTELEQFAYVASHDLREPLRMVSSYVDLLGRRYGDRLDEDAREFIAFAKDGATRMDHLVVDLLEYSRIGRRTRSMAAVRLDTVLDRVTLALQAKITETGARIVMPPPPLPTVLGDGEELTRLLQNLIGNAVKYRAPERAPVVTVGVERQGPFWDVSVDDNGIGIDPQYFERIFLIFQRLHKRGEYEGTGIGLAICKKIVEHHGGRIWLESTPGKGSAFHVTLPAVD